MEPYYKDDAVIVYNGNCLDVLPQIKGAHSCVTDPPYGLAFGDWDLSVPGEEYWSAVSGALRPGAHLLAFSSARTYHRMAVAIEDAGFEIRDQIMWLYGSGMAKAHPVDYLIDKELGVYGDRVVHKLAVPGKASRVFGPGPKAAVSDPASDEAKQWVGWRALLKPAHEPIALARKPMNGTLARNIMEHGTGALNIDGARINSTDDDGDFPDGGRYPADVIHDGSDEIYESIPLADRRRQLSKIFYTPKAGHRGRYGVGFRSTHPTIKPSDLMEHLVLLVTPPNGIVLDPFAGSMTTAVAAKRNGFRAIMIEMSEQYCEEGAKRIEATTRSIIDE